MLVLQPRSRPPTEGTKKAEVSSHVYSIADLEAPLLLLLREKPMSKQKECSSSSVYSAHGALECSRMGAASHRPATSCDHAKVRPNEVGIMIKRKLSSSG